MTGHLHLNSLLPQVIPEGAILRRLGYRLNTTEIDAGTGAWLHTAICRAAKLCRPQGVYTLTEVSCCRPERLELTLSQEHPWIIENVPGLFTLFNGAKSAWIAAATVGPDIISEIHRLTDAHDTAGAALTDATGSECADAAMDSLQAMAAQALRPRGLLLSSHRFSPGYGGWDLSHQWEFFAILELTRTLRLSLNEASLITPEKSVTAIAPVFWG